MPRVEQLTHNDVECVQLSAQPIIHPTGHRCPRTYAELCMLAQHILELNQRVKALEPPCKLKQLISPKTYRPKLIRRK